MMAQSSRTPTPSSILSRSGKVPEDALKTPEAFLSAMFGEKKAALLTTALSPERLREVTHKEALRQVEVSTHNIAMMIGMGVMAGENLSAVRERMIATYTEMQRTAAAEDTRLTLRPSEWALADAIKALDRVIADP